MKPEIKAQWLTALRSGEYRQGKERLRVGDSFCCLGVLCDLAAKRGIGEWIDGTFYVGDSHAEAILPQEVAFDWADLGSCSPWVSDRALYRLNDGDEDCSILPHTFAEIADLIEAHL